MEKMPLDVRLDVEKNIANIENGTFNEQNMKTLLVDLREYSDQKIFIDFANFVTHHNRTEGDIYDIIYKKYCIFKGFVEYKPKFEKRYLIDQKKAFEKWEYDFLLAQLDSLPRFRVYRYIKCDKKKAKDKLMSCFTKKDGSRYIQKGKLDEAQQIFDMLLSLLKAPKPFLSGDEVFNSFIETLSENNVKFDNQKFLHYKNEIIIAFLINANNKRFQVSRKNKKLIGDIKISFDYDHKENRFGNLMLSATVKVFKNEKGGIIIPVLTTNIGKGDLISDKLFKRLKWNKGDKRKFVFKVGSALTLNNEDGELKLSEKV